MPGGVPVFSAVPALIISPDPSERDFVGEVVRKCGLRPLHCPNLADACAMLTENIFALVICSDRLSDSDLYSSLKSLAGASAGTPVIVLSRHAEWEACVAAIDAGAFDYIACPLRSVEAERILRIALAHSGHAPETTHAAA
jgi:DNA-binding NtrC family response regulator